MTARIFVDTNVFVYWLDSSYPAKRSTADEWIKRLWREQTGRTSMQVLNELYICLTRKLKRRTKPEDAWDIAAALFAWEPQPTDRPLLLLAREIEARYAISWWDSLIVAAAQQQDCAVLLSEDLQHGMRFQDVLVQNPFVGSVQEMLVPYQVERLPSRHRPRGRPPKRGGAASVES